MPLPRVALTLGDVAGIGPELVARTWLDPALHECCVPVAVGHPRVLRRAAELVGSGQEVVETDADEPMVSLRATIPCVAAGGDGVLQVPPAAVDARAGQAAFDALALAVELAMAGRVDAVVTAPLNKQALRAAGLPYPGHTEALAALTETEEVAMMLYLAPGGARDARAGLGVVHVTLHMGLTDVPRHVTIDAVLAKARLAHQAMLRLGRGSNVPRIGLAALNPHAGEGGLFGDEEQRILMPAVERARREGIDLSLPLPADSLFWRACQGQFDAVVAMYHDQGHVALKLVGFHRAVNVTLGLPVVRTSPTYGTAFDIAWRGVARADGMLEAVRVAAVLAQSENSPTLPGNQRCNPGGAQLQAVPGELP